MVSELISFSALQLSSNWFDSQLLNYALLLFDPKKETKKKQKKNYALLLVTLFLGLIGDLPHKFVLKFQFTPYIFFKKIKDPN